MRLGYKKNGAYLMPRQTFADRTAAHILALSSAAADAFCAGVGAATGAAVWAADVSSPASTHRSLSAPYRVLVGNLLQKKVLQPGSN
jgi:hypothetical protein